MPTVHMAQKSPRHTLPQANTQGVTQKAPAQQSAGAQGAYDVEHCCVLPYLCILPKPAGMRLCWSLDTRLDGPLVLPRAFIHTFEVS